MEQVQISNTFDSAACTLEQRLENLKRTIQQLRSGRLMWLFEAQPELVEGFADGTLTYEGK